MLVIIKKERFNKELEDYFNKLLFLVLLFLIILDLAWICITELYFQAKEQNIEPKYYE